ncbi:MAG: 50S ribosomal protein L13 [Candidatus Micrarchaeota archaeon]
MIVIDCKNLIFGRVASHAAKQALNGEEVHLINAEQMVVCGNPTQISDRYKQKRRLQNKGTPEHSPRWPRVPHMLVKRMVRGMLPRKTMRGREAMKRLMVYAGNPKNLEGNAKLAKAEYDGVTKHITILGLCKSLGYTG